MSRLSGYHHTEETKKKIGLGNKNKTISKEAIAKMVNTRKSNGSYIPWNKGKRRIYSDLYRKRISEGHMGIKPWQKQLGDNHPDVLIYKEKMRQLAFKFKGRTFSNVTKQKMSVARKAEKNPNWQGGLSYEPYGKDFGNRLKEQIRNRDCYRCQQCFRHQNELTEKLVVHHIDFNKKNNCADNLISLCRSCHSQMSFNREQWIKYFQNRMFESGK